MDAGAHFKKCDFQVHTPRDPKWVGPGAVSEDERREYAIEFVAACREKKLQAVAITDHHDFALFRYIREAAANETDANGKDLDPALRLVVFPGMEVTLGLPCQVLLILDADFPAEFLPLVNGALGITPADAALPKHPAPQKLNIVEIGKLYDDLNKSDALRNRFIVLPNVTDAGHQSMLRKGFEKHYIGMPCVGGYVDGGFPDGKKGIGIRAIVAGEDKAYGNKRIGVFQTSDSRSRDFVALGAHSTWVKWAQPTAEALRQACLASQSRISLREPVLPQVFISRLEVTNSKFLGPMTLDFNPQYNAIIGSRGAGKSSILEYVRWALCDQPPSFVDSSGEMPDHQKRRQGLIAGTLVPLEAAVDVTFSVNGVVQTVRRKAKGDLTIKIGDGPFQACEEQVVRDLLPIQAYSQKQLSSVGARLDELRRFINSPVQGELDGIASRMATVEANLRVAFEKVTQFRTIESSIAARSVERQSLEQQLAAVRSSLQGLSEEDLAVLARQSNFDSEHRVVSSLERDLARARSILSDVASELAQMPKKPEQPLQANSDISQAYDAFSSWARGAQAQIEGLVASANGQETDNHLKPFYDGVAQWRVKRDEHKGHFDESKARSATHEQALGQIQTIEARLSESNEDLDIKRQELGRLDGAAEAFLSLHEEWKKLHKDRAAVLEQQCQRLTEIASSRLRATLKRAADIGPLAERFRSIVKGSGLRSDRVEKLLELITASHEPLDAWHEILQELYQLAWLHAEDDSTVKLPQTPRLDLAAFSAKDKIALARQLQPSAWLSLLLYDLQDVPIFEYRIREDDFLPFEKASPGQQATALLTILLHQEGPPLLVDQPEDDLNMKIINEIVATLWEAKSRRQIIFASHNANLVVNGDAELVVACDYRTSSAESSGKIKLCGAIDMPAINLEITEVMEGGADAFRLRQQKYGF